MTYHALFYNPDRPASEGLRTQIVRITGCETEREAIKYAKSMTPQFGQFRGVTKAR